MIPNYNVNFSSCFLHTLASGLQKTGKRLQSGCLMQPGPKLPLHRKQLSNGNKFSSVGSVTAPLKPPLVPLRFSILSVFIVRHRSDLNIALIAPPSGKIKACDCGWEAACCHCLEAAWLTCCMQLDLGPSSNQLLQLHGFWVSWQHKY